MLRPPEAALGAFFAVTVILCFLPREARTQDEGQDLAPNPTSETVQIAGLNVAVWRPAANSGERPPLIVYFAGFTACNTGSSFLTAALAESGYLVVAPDHEDSACLGPPPQAPEAPFGKPEAWNDNTYRRRGRDIATLIDAMKKDAEWSPQFDAARIGLMGHSLGGYTVLALAGARPSWQLEGVKAVIAMAPLIGPLLRNGRLDRIGVPVMYQTGARDGGTATLVKKPGGAFDETPAAMLVEFAGANHFAWNDGAGNLEHEIAAVSVAFFDTKLRGKDFKPPRSKAIATFKTK